MNRRAAICCVTGALMSCVLLVACDDDESTGPDECGGTKGTYVLTPTTPAPGPSYQLSDRYVYHSREQDGGGAPDCDLIIYDDCPDEADNYFQYTVGAGCALQTFNAGLGTGLTAYEFVGDPVRAYNTGSGPFATGFYTRFDGQQGTFEFYEEGRTP